LALQCKPVLADRKDGFAQSSVTADDVIALECREVIRRVFVEDSFQGRWFDGRLLASRRHKQPTSKCSSQDDHLHVDAIALRHGPYSSGRVYIALTLWPHGSNLDAARRDFKTTSRPALLLLTPFETRRLLGPIGVT